jgi:hypothetical protein
MKMKSKIHEFQLKKIKMMSKRIITILLMSSAVFANAQAFKGAGDIKVGVGANIQQHGTGINITSDFGIGENMSYGFTTSYMLNSSHGNVGDLKFSDKFDLKARFNANIGKVILGNDQVDIYPGLDLSLRNFGAHLGGRYFFSDGFGVYTEIGFPLAKYNYENDGPYNNQFVTNIGISFNL